MDAAAAQPVTRVHDADVCVVGAGPAGLALAAQLARRGLAVVCVDPHGAWPARYSLWLDEARDLEVVGWLSTTWLRTIVRTGSDVHELGRADATLDNTRARAGLAA